MHLRRANFILLTILLNSGALASTNAQHAVAEKKSEVQATPFIAPASGEAKEALSKMQLMKDCTAEVAAAEPLLANPVSFFIDTNGDYYICETFRHSKGVTDIRSHMDWCDDDLASRTVEDRVQLLKKHTGDGFAEYSKYPERIRWIRADGSESKIFADNFNDPASGIGAGVLKYKYNVYYTCIPDLWLLKDTNHDGVADQKKVLQHGYGVHIAMLGHDLHGLKIGPDGKLYFSCGDRALNVETPGGRVEWPEAGAVLRCNLDGSELEIFARGLRNPQELAFDEFGNLFTGDNNSDGGDRARWVHVVEGADYGWRYGYQWIGDPHLRGPWNEEKLWHPHFAGQAAYIVPPVSWLGNGPSGLCYNPGTALGPEFNNHFFLVEFEGDPGWSGILTFTVKPKGASFELGPVEKFVWSALPTDCDFGPDGSLYFIDWVSGWDASGKGRIYKVTHGATEKNTAAQQTRLLLKSDLSQLQIGEFYSLLSHADQRVRQAAQFELASRGAEGAAVLEKALKEGDAVARRHGIWGLEMAARAKAWNRYELFYNLLNEIEPDILVQAARACGDLKLKDSAAPMTKLLLRSPQAPVRLAACIALSKIIFPDAVSELLRVAAEAGEDDPALRHGAALALSTCATTAELLALSGDENAHKRVAAIVALRLKKDAAVSAFLQDKDPRVLAEAARAIYDLPLADGYSALAQLLANDKITEMPVLRRALGAALRLGGRDNALAMAQFAARASAPEAARAEAIEHLKNFNNPGPRDAVTGEWRPVKRLEKDVKDAAEWLPAVVAGIASVDFNKFPESLQIAWLKLVAQYNIKDQVALVADCLQDTKRPAKVRGESLRTLVALKPADIAARLTPALSDPVLDVRVAAVENIRAVAPSEALAAAKSALTQGSPAELRIAYEIIAEDSSADAELLFKDLKNRYEKGLLPAETRLDFADAIRKRFKIKDNVQLNEILPSRAAQAALDEVVAPWLDSLQGGDAAHGNHIFRNNNSLSCIRCHKTNSDDAGVVGPDLRGLSTRATRLQILESILEPNRKITNGYKATVFELKNGTVASGRVESEDGKIVKIRKADNTLTEISASDIQELRDDVSAMPDGLGRFLTQREMRDLIEFLATLK